MNAALGQEQGLNDHIKIAQQYFQVSIEISSKSLAMLHGLKCPGFRFIVRFAN